MSLTKVTATVLNANAISNAAVSNASVNRSGHIANEVVELKHLAATANTRVLNDGTISNVNTVTANVNTVSGNVELALVSVVIVSSNAATMLLYGLNASTTGSTSHTQLQTPGNVDAGQGVKVPVAGRLTHITAQLDVQTAADPSVTQVDLFINGSDASTNGNNVVVNGAATGDVGNTNVISKTFSAGDRLLAKFKHSSGSLQTQDIVVALRYE